MGIDFGTNYSCVGLWTGENVEIIPNDQGNSHDIITTPALKQNYDILGPGYTVYPILSM